MLTAPEGPVINDGAGLLNFLAKRYIQWHNVGIVPNNN